MQLLPILLITCSLWISIFADSIEVKKTPKNDSSCYEMMFNVQLLLKENDDFKQKIEKLQEDSKNVEEYKNIIDRQDKRIEDLNTKMAGAAEDTSLIAIIVGIFTLAVAIFGAVIPYIIYRQNKNVQEEARKDLELWKKDSEIEFKNNLSKELEEVKQHKKNTIQEMSAQGQEVYKKASELKELDVNISDKNSTDKKSLDEAISFTTHQVVQTPTYDNWMTLGSLKYQEKNYAGSLLCWEEAQKYTQDEQKLVYALANKAIALGQLNKHEEAIQSCDELINQFGFDDNNEIQIIVSRTMLNRGFHYGELHKYEEAIQSCDELINRFGSSESQEMQMQILNAMSNKGIFLVRLNKHEKIIQSCDELLNRFESSNNETIQIQIANTLFMKAFHLGELLKYEEAIQTCDELISRFRFSSNEQIQIQIANATSSKCSFLGRLNEYEKAIQSCDEFISRFKYSNNQKIQITVAGIMVSKSFHLGELHKYEEAIQLCDELINRFGSNESQEMQTHILNAILNKGIFLERLHQLEEAIQLFDESLKRFKSSNDEKIQIQLASILTNQTVLLGQLNRHEEAIQSYDEFISRFGSSNNQEMQVQIVKAISNKGVHLGELKKYEDAVKLYNQVINRIGFNSDLEIQSEIEKCIINKFEIEMIMGKTFDSKDIENIKKNVTTRESIFVVEFLKTIFASLENNQIEKIEQLKHDYSDLSLNWSWKILDTWAEALDEPKKIQVQKTINMFRNWKA